MRRSSRQQSIRLFFFYSYFSGLILKTNADISKEFLKKICICQNLIAFCPAFWHFLFFPRIFSL